MNIKYIGYLVLDIVQCRAFLARRRGYKWVWSARNRGSRAGELKMDWTKPPRCRWRYGY